MNKKILGIFVCTLLILASMSLTVLADWKPGDGHKMHYPQLPDPFGWDVDATYVESVWPQNCLADDWKCSESGPVTDIHFWGSWYNDNAGAIIAFVIAIHADIPADPPSIPYSRPGLTLWERTFYPDDWVVAGPLEGPQGWYDPGEGFYIPENHFLYWQYNIEHIEDPFIQEDGTIYWLSISAIVAIDSPQPRWGWKSSTNHWNDDAVHGLWYELDWVDLYEPPDFGTSLDLAFVITGGDTSNHPPNTPSKPSGPTSVTEGVQYTYTTKTTDPDGDNVKYGWDFDGDGVVEPGHWTSFLSSGATCAVKITFYGAGTRYLSVIAEDIHGAQSGFSPTLIVVVSGANNAPNTPSTPSGPASGVTGTSYAYSTSTTDPDGDNVKYGWDWDGDGTVDEWTGFYSSGTTVSTSHSWSTGGTYNVKVRAEDSNGAQSGFSSAKTVVINSPPNKPTITGPTSGKAGKSYTYSTYTTDPDGDQVYYWFDWDDGTSSGWKGPYNSGQTVSVSHVWTSQGSYSIKVKAKDIHDAESIWSDPLSVSMPRNKAVNLLFLRFLEEHPRLFPIIRFLLEQ